MDRMLKFCIIDMDYVMHGSYNWTLTANNNDNKNTTTTVIIVFDRPNLSNIPPYITRPIPLQIDIRPTIVATEDASIFFAISFTIPLACDISAKPDALRRIAHTK